MKEKKSSNISKIKRVFSRRTVAGKKYLLKNAFDGKTFGWEVVFPKPVEGAEANRYIRLVTKNLSKKGVLVQVIIWHPAIGYRTVVVSVENAEYNKIIKHVSVRRMFLEYIDEEEEEEEEPDYSDVPIQVLGIRYHV